MLASSHEVDTLSLCRMSLAWAPQLIAMLYDPHGVVVAPLLTRLAREYPQALYFPFHVSKAALEKHDGISGDPARRDALRAMSAALESPEIEQLVAGFSDVLHPNLRMIDLVKELVGARTPPISPPPSRLLCPPPPP